MGRKKTVLITQAVAFLGALCIVFAKTVTLFCIGNFLAGYTNSVFMGVAPIYTSEINQPKIRKFTGSFLANSFFLGLALTYLVGWLSTWKVAAYIQTIWPCIIFVFLLFCPESPTWLIVNGRHDLARETLIQLRGDEEVAMKELSRIKDNLEKQKLGTTENIQSTYARDQLKLVTKGTFVRPCLVVTILMAMCWPWTGGMSIQFYTPDLLKKFEIPADQYLASTALGCYQLLCGLCGILISSLLPRRKFYIFSGICIFIGSFMLATIVHLRRYAFFVDTLNESTTLRWIPVIALLVYFAGYSTGYVSIGFMLLGELLPSNAREMGSFLINQCTNISLIILIKFVPDLQEVLGLDGLFCLFSGIAVFSIIFAYFCIPETFGKSLEEIEEHYRTICYSNHLRNSNKVPEIINLSYVSD
jgi:MFS family permease